MSRVRISGEQPWQVLSHSAVLSPSSEGYTLQFSANGIDYTDYPETVPANESLMVCNCAKFTYFRCKGNQSIIDINF